MIPLERDAAPTVLAERGQPATQRDCNAYLQNQAEYDSGRSRFAFDSTIYGSSAIRKLLTRQQHGKCCYCESAHSATSAGRIDHFRPKGAVRQGKTNVRSRPRLLLAGLRLAQSPARLRNVQPPEVRLLPARGTRTTSSQSPRSDRARGTAAPQSLYRPRPVQASRLHGLRLPAPDRARARHGGRAWIESARTAGAAPERTQRIDASADPRPPTRPPREHAATGQRLRAVAHATRRAVHCDGPPLSEAGGREIRKSRIEVHFFQKTYSSSHEKSPRFGLIMDRHDGSSDDFVLFWRSERVRPRTP